jgi:hypothetical protein
MLRRLDVSQLDLTEVRALVAAIDPDWQPPNDPREHTKS